MLEHAKKVKDATGVNYLGTFTAEGPAAMRTMVALMAQQGVDPYLDDTANFTTDAARNALKAIKDMGDNGYANLKPAQDQVRNEFLTGKTAVIIDGTWRVDATRALIGQEGIALKNYYVSYQPQLFSQEGAWADTHMWAIPAQLKKEDPEKFQAALKVLAHINNHNIDWARTGHLPVRKSVLNSEELAALPYRSGYAKTAEIAYYMKPAKKYGAIQDAIGRNLVEFYQNDKPLEDTLKDIQEAVEDALN
jgi:multiple sugar transport system substrate-binding protein